MPIGIGTLEQQTPRAFGIKFDLYNAATLDTIAVWCSTSNSFAPAYQPSVLETSQPTFELRFGKPMSKLSDFTWAVANGPCQAGAAISHDRLSDLFANGYVAIGQEVTVVMLVLNGTATESSAIWYGYITDCKWDLERVEFTAVHQVLRALEKIIPETAVTLGAYPEAPNESIGAPLPIVLGDWSVDPTDAGNADAWNKSAELMQLTPIERVLPTICIDTNISYPVSGPSFVLAGHACKSCPPATSNAVFCYDSGLEQFTVISSADLAITNAAGGTSVLLGPAYRISAAIKPIGVDGTSDALNPTSAYDNDLGTSATLSASHTALHLLLPAIPDIGVIESLTVYVHTLSGTLSGAERLEFGLNDGGFGAWWPTPVTAHSSIATITSDAIETYAITGALYYSGQLPTDLGIAVNIANVGAGVVYVGEVRLVVTYTRRGGYHVPARSKGKVWYPPARRTLESETFPELAEVGTLVYLAATGVADTGAGAYTGVASALIERPCDIIQYLATAEAGLTPLTSGHASFATVRTDIGALGITGRVHIDKQQVVGNLMSRLAEESVSGLAITSNSLGLVFWGSAASDNDYGTPIDGADLLACEIGRTPLSEIRNAVYVQCGYHATLKKCKHMAYIDGAGSDNGSGGTETGDAALSVLLAASEAAYGRKELHLNCEHLRVANIHHIRDYYAAMLCEPRVTLRFTLGWVKTVLQVGHVIEVDDASWQALGLKYPGTTGGLAGSWSHGGTTRRFWVERVTYMNNGTIEIEASEGAW